MKNYFDRLGLHRQCSQAEILTAIKNAESQTTDLQSLLEAESILSDPTCGRHYTRTHLQYEAISAALHCLESSQAVDTHRWTERLVEFSYPSETPAPRNSEP